jgi:acyl carrier protein
MVPAAFVVLEALPLTTNGKVDRRALPVPNDVNPETTSAYVAPRSPVEDTLVAIWAELLQLKQVGIHHSFFEVGGHSLLATQMVSRVRDTLGIEVPLQSVFEAPTIAKLAKVIEALQANTAPTPAPALVRLDRQSRRRLRSSLGPQD